MINSDTTNPATYGSCEINHGKSVTWDMGDGTRKFFEYVETFNLGTEASGTDQNENVIARYEDLTDEGNFYLMQNCDLWESDHTQQQVMSTLGSIIKAPFVAVFGAVKFVF